MIVFLEITVQEKMKKLSFDYRIIDLKHFRHYEISTLSKI